LYEQTDGDGRYNMNEEAKQSIKTVLLVVVLFFSFVAYGQTEPVIVEEVAELPQVEKMKQSPPSGQQRIDLGGIGVVVAGFRPNAHFGRPRTKGDVASDYAQQGTFLMLSTATVGGFMLAPVAAVAGAVFGAIRGESEGAIKETENILNGYLAAVDFQGILRDHLLVVSAEQTRHLLIPLDLKGPINRGEKVAYDVSSYPDIDTVLEIALDTCSLTGGQGVNPDLSLSVEGQIKFVSAKDAKAISIGPIGCSGNSTYEFTEWARNNAQPFKDEIGRVFPCLANQIIELVSYLEKNTPDKPLDEAK
jgi:hypothetical protein